MSQEIKIDGIAIAPDVLTTIVVRSLADIEGVASVGNNDLAANLVSMFLVQDFFSVSSCGRSYGRRRRASYRRPPDRIFWLSV